MSHWAPAVGARPEPPHPAPPSLPPGRAALLGVVAVGVALWLDDVVAAVVAGTDLFPPLDAVVRAGARSVAAWAVLLALGALAGLLGRRRAWRGAALMVLVGVVGALVVAVAGDALALGTLAPALVGVAAGLLFGALHRLLGPRPATPPAHRPAPAAGSTTRRNLLLAAGIAAAGVGFVGFSRSFGGAPVAVVAPLRLVTPPAPGPAPTDPVRRGPVVDVRTLGAVGDGRTDDGPAIRAALAKANPVGGTVFFPPGVYYYRATGGLDPAAGATLAGVPGRSVLALDTATPGAYVPFCTPKGDDVLVDGLTINRVGDFPCVLFLVRDVARLTLSRLTLNGNVPPGAADYCHGIQLGLLPGSTTGVTVAHCSFTGLSYGLFQTNASTAQTRTVRVSDCTFTANRQTDLEFNSPLGEISDVVVERCRFSDRPDYGFGLGVAHVSGLVVRDCSFTNYASEAVHIEDYSDDVLVQGNLFSACGLQDYSHVQVIGGSTNVRIVGNSFVASMNTDPIHCVALLAGGTDPTAGNRPPGPPSDVLVRDNGFDCATPVGGVYLENVDGAVVTGNVLVGDGVRARHGEQAQQRAFTVVGTSPTLTDNTINGLHF